MSLRGVPRSRRAATLAAAGVAVGWAMLTEALGDRLDGEGVARIAGLDEAVLRGQQCEAQQVGRHGGEGGDVARDLAPRDIAQVRIGLGQKTRERVHLTPPR